MDRRRHTFEASPRADARRRRVRRTGLGLVAAGIALTLPAANSGAQSVEQLNSQIASAQSQAQGLGAEIDAKTAQVAAAHSQAAAAAAREAQLSAVLVQGQQREAELAAPRPGDPGTARQDEGPPAPRRRRAVGPPRVGLQGRRAGRDGPAAQLEGLRRACQPRRAPRPDRERRRGARRHRAPAPRPGGGRARPGQGGSCAGDRVQSARCRRPRPDRQRPRQRRGASGPARAGARRPGVRAVKPPVPGRQLGAAGPDRHNRSLQRRRSRRSRAGSGTGRSRRRS